MNLCTFSLDFLESPSIVLLPKLDGDFGVHVAYYHSTQLYHSSLHPLHVFLIFLACFTFQFTGTLCVHRVGILKAAWPETIIHFTTLIIIVYLVRMRSRGSPSPKAPPLYKLQSEKPTVVCNVSWCVKRRIRLSRSVRRGS